MADYTYSRTVLQELKSLKKLASSRELDGRLKKIALLLKQRKNGDLSSSDALEGINQIAGSSPLVWNDGADPGVHVAHAFMSGFLDRKDFSKSAWTAVEIFITLAGI